MASSKKNALNTSLRSDTQATDSARNGCNANIAATKALHQNAPVIRRKAKKSMIAAAACNRTLVKWCPPASGPLQRSGAPGPKK